MAVILCTDRRRTMDLPAIIEWLETNIGPVTSHRKAQDDLYGTDPEWVDIKREWIDVCGSVIGTECNPVRIYIQGGDGWKFYLTITSNKDRGVYGYVVRDFFVFEDDVLAVQFKLSGLI